MKKFTTLMLLFATCLHGSNPSDRSLVVPFNPGVSSVWNSTATVSGQNVHARSFSPLAAARPDAAVFRPSIETSLIAGTRSVLDPEVVIYETAFGTARVKGNMFILQPAPQAGSGVGQALCRVAPKIHNKALFQELSKVVPSLVYPVGAEHYAQSENARNRPFFNNASEEVAFERTIVSRYF